MKFFTYTNNKSTSVGGIEIVTRFLQKVAQDNNFDVFELFHGISCEEIHPQNEKVNYIKMPANKSESNVLLKAITYLKRRWVTYQYLKSYFTGNNGVLVLHHPNILNFIPSSVLKTNKIILIQHNAFDVYFNFVVKIGFKLNYKYIDNIVVYTDYDKRDLSTRYLNKNILDKTFAIPLACRLDRLKNQQEKKYSKKLVTISRIEECQKNFKSMCNIMLLLPKDFTLDIYGIGTDEEVKRLEVLIQDSPQIKYKGITKNVQKTLSEYATFIMSSHYEGYGQTLIEARSQGLPLVAFNTFNALPSIVDNGSNGFVVEPYDHDAFASSIKTILSSEERYEFFSRNALLKAAETDAVCVAKLWSELLQN